MSDTHLQLRDSDLHYREVDGELVVLDLHQSRYLTVNASGRVIWEPLREGATRDQLIERLAEAFGIENPRAAADVDAFIDELDSRGMLVRTRSPV